jgi:hypothetical protein
LEQDVNMRASGSVESPEYVMRRVNRDELAYAVAATLRKAPPSVWKLVMDERQKSKARGRASVANIVAAGLSWFEKLTSAPALVSDDMFSRLLADMLGEAAETGAPAVE